MKAWHILVLILCFLTLGAYTQPRIERVNTLKNQYKNLESEIESFNKKVNTVVNLKKEQQTKQEDFSKNIPQENEQEELIQDIRRLTVRNGFSFEDISFVKGKNAEVGLPEIKATFSTKGSRSRLIRFLESIETNERFLGMESLSVQTQKEENSTVVQFQVSLYAFYQQES